VILEEKQQSGRNEFTELQVLNEVTIMRKDENMSQMEIYVNNVLLTVVQGDG
jgi:NAD kinase